MLGLNLKVTKTVAGWGLTPYPIGELTMLRRPNSQIYHLHVAFSASPQSPCTVGACLLIVFKDLSPPLEIWRFPGRNVFPTSTPP